MHTLPVVQLAFTVRWWFLFSPFPLERSDRPWWRAPCICSGRLDLVPSSVFWSRQHLPARANQWAVWHHRLQQGTSSNNTNTSAVGLNDWMSNLLSSLRGSSGCSSAEDGVWFPLRARLCAGTQRTWRWLLVDWFLLQISLEVRGTGNGQDLKTLFHFRAISNTLPTEAPSGMTYGDTWKW